MLKALCFSYLSERKLPIPSQTSLKQRWNGLTFPKLREQISLLDVFERDIVPPLSLHKGIAASQFQGAAPGLRVTKKHRALHSTSCLFS